MRVFVSAGEASGDAYGAALVGEMRRIWGEPSSLTFEGIGGSRMNEAGVQLHADSGRWGAISIVQSLRVVPRVLRGYYAAKGRMGRGEPGLFIPIDFGYANIRLARHAKNRGWKVLYFVPPGSWRRDRQGGDLPVITDAISTPFEWSAEILREMGADAHWFGHPIKQLLRASASQSQSERRTVAVLPGSREHEIAENLPVIAAAIKAGEREGLNLVTPAGSEIRLPLRWEALDMPLEFALAPTVDVEAFRARWRALAPERQGDVFTRADTQGVLRRARAALVCSGTATLEAALCKTPTVVLYRVSKSVVMEAKLVRFKRPKFIALPNILLDRFAVPELLQDEATPGAVRTELDAVLEDGERREAQLRDFEALDAMLGPDDAITRTADLARRMFHVEPR